jgi:hypothetical protein
VYRRDWRARRYSGFWRGRRNWSDRWRLLIHDGRGLLFDDRWGLLLHDGWGRLDRRRLVFAHR